MHVHADMFGARQKGVFLSGKVRALKTLLQRGPFILRQITRHLAISTRLDWPPRSLLSEILYTAKRMRLHTDLWICPEDAGGKNGFGEA